jgi:hypothetical protein
VSDATFYFNGVPIDYVPDLGAARHPWDDVFYDFVLVCKPTHFVVFRKGRTIFLQNGTRRTFERMGWNDEDGRLSQFKRLYRRLMNAVG